MQADFAAMRQSIIEGAAEHAADLALRALAQGVPPLEAIDQGFVPGMSEVGEQFAQRRMFLPDMLASAEAMKAAMAVLEPELKRHGEERPSAGTVVLGTTKGDIHEIGKTLVGTLLTANGFKVHDLGVDVASEQFARDIGRFLCRRLRPAGDGVLHVLRVDGNLRRFSGRRDFVPPAINAAADQSEEDDG